MKKIAPVIAMFIISVTACHKEKKVLGCTDPNAINYNLSANTNDGTCQYCPIPVGSCAANTDTALANQLILGRWHLKRIDMDYPRNNRYSLCNTGTPDYLEFLPNHQLNIHDTSGSIKTIMYEFGVDNQEGMYDKFRILDSINSVKENVTVCDSLFTIYWWNPFPSYHFYYVKE